MDTRKKRMTLKQYEDFLYSVWYDLVEAIGEIGILEDFRLISGSGVTDMKEELTTLLKRIEAVVDVE